MANTPRSIAEALNAAVKWLRSPPAALRSMYRVGSRDSYADEARALADELQALATANGAEGLPELPEAVCHRFRIIGADRVAREWGHRGEVCDPGPARIEGHDGDMIEYQNLYTADQMRAYALATRPQAASDGEDARMAAKRLVEAAIRGRNATGSMCPVDVFFWAESEYPGMWQETSATIDAAMTTDAAKGEG